MRSDTAKPVALPGIGASNPRSRILNYALAVFGPVGVAAAQFLLSFQLLHAVTPASFGAFAFLLLTSQLAFSISSALLCAPLPVLASGENRDQVVRCLVAANLVLGVTAFVVFCAVGMALGMPQPAGYFFAAYTGAMLLRWFARTYAYVTNARWRTIASDITYTLVLLGCLCAMALCNATSLNIACAGLFVAATLGLVPFGRTFLRHQFFGFSWKALSHYKGIWRVHSKWSLTGVLTTEATANAHAYAVTLIAGSAAFAPIAGSALLIRPIGLATNALTDIERPQMARQLAKNDVDGALESSRHFAFTLVAAWGLSATAAIVLLLTNPRILFPENYDINVITLGAALWFAIAGMRLWRAPQSTLLQAAGQFKSVAHASYLSCFASIIVAAVLSIWGPTWSLLGILLGETIFAAGIHVRAQAWKASMKRAAVSPAGSETSPDQSAVKSETEKSLQ